MDYGKIALAYFHHRSAEAAYGVQVFGIIHQGRRLLMLNFGIEQPYHGGFASSTPRWSERVFLNRVDDGGPDYVQAIIDADDYTILRWYPNGHAGATPVGFDAERGSFMYE